jgi:serine/threonine protein kinase/tetratricopeptide (TPR) repeat protein
MNCPHCGGNTPVAQGRCSGCGKLVSARQDVATAVLTPPPTPAPDMSTIDADLMFTGLGQTRMPGLDSDSEITGFITPSPRDADATGFDTPLPRPHDDMTQLPDMDRPSASAGPLAIGQRFGPRYRIVKLLGIGGMGAVYQAWDSELDVVVALKVIRPEATSDPHEVAAIERRFKQELLLARQVTHKNVVRIHDLGEIDGIKYITMSFIQGADLATVLQRDGKLPVPAALRIMRELVSGLAAAHEAGVVHRDLKPANIMIEGDHAVIMDFGIARSSGGAQTPAVAGALGPAGRKSRNAAHTQAGSIVGTIAYMAPEQAKGQPVDQRADMYSLGLIVSDMLIGLRQRSSDLSAVEELKRRITQRPPALRSVDPNIPEALDHIVARLLEPDPGARFQTTAELVAALDRLDDNGVPLPLIRRLTPRLVAATAAIVTLLLAGTFFATRQALAPPVQHDPISVVIADFQNNTNDVAFNGVLEPTLRRALEGAGFITAFDRDGIRRTLGVPPPATLNEEAARGIAVNQGLGVVLAGSIAPQGSGYTISLKASHAVTGEVITNAQARAAGKAQVIEETTRLLVRVRRALGDEASESAQMFAMASVSATSLDVVRYWVQGRDAASRNDYDEAMRNYAKAVELDPKFGLGYAGLANVSSNRTNQKDAEKYIKEALRYVDGMTERERFTTRGGFYRLTGDYRQCVKEYGDLLQAYPADVAARNNLAICLANLRDFSQAFDQLRQVVAIVPNRAMYRTNLASYANFSSDFVTGEEEAKKVEKPDVNALMALAFAQVGQGQIDLARTTYRTVGAIGELGTSLATSGLGDLASVEGRFTEAARILEQGAAVDLKAERPDWAAAKLAALAHTELWRGQPRRAIAAADKALVHADAASVQFMAARAYIQGNAVERARPLMAMMASQTLAEPRAYAKIIEGEIALKAGNHGQAVEALTQANALVDTWLGHFDLGRAYLEAGQFLQADAEFDRCLKRRGEALQLILGDEPTFAYVPFVYYYQGRVREGMGTAGFADSYRRYLDIRGNSTDDPLVPEIRKRIGG